MINRICQVMSDLTAFIGGQLYRTIDCYNRIRLKPKYRCIISNNCNGGLICKSLKMRYNSPTVGLSILIKDIIYALNNYDYFFVENKYNIRKIDTSDDCPWGYLGRKNKDKICAL